MDARRGQPDQPAFGARCTRSLRRVTLLVLLVAAAAVALKYWSIDRLDEEVRSRVEQELRQRLPHLAVRVKSARRVRGKGIEIRGIRLYESRGGQKHVLVEVEEVLAECDTHFPDFVTQTPEFRKVQIRGLKLRGERHDDGTWNLMQLAKSPRAGQAPYPPITIEDGELEIVDGQRGALSLRKINLAITPVRRDEKASTESQTRQPLVRLRGTLAGDHVESVELDGLWDPAAGDWELRGAVEGLEFTPRLRKTLPLELAELLSPLSSVRGRTHFGFRITRQHTAAREIDFEIDGQIAEGRIDDDRLPDPLTDVEATIHCDNESLRIDDLSARCGQTVIESLSAELHGLSVGSPLTVTLTARHVDLQRVPIEHLPAGVREAWARFSPRGHIDLSGQLHFDGQKWHPQLAANCLDLSVLYDRFPYRVTDGTGTIALEYDRLTSDMKFIAGAQAISCKAVILSPGKDFTGEVKLASLGPLVLDRRMIEALDPKQQQIVSAFHPRGAITFDARFWRNPQETLIHRHVTLNLHEATIQHDKFRYPIDGISGLLLLQDNDWTFRNLSGHNDSAQIAGSGYWMSMPGPDGNQLSLTFTASSVALEDELREALAPAVQRLWTSVRPRGTLDQVTVRMQYNPSQRNLVVEVDAHKRAGAPTSPISIEPSFFRYRLEELTGDFFYSSATGMAHLKNVRAAHEKTQVAAEGSCRIQTDGSCGVRLTKLIAYRVRPDHELLAALPGGIGQPLSRLAISGPLNLEGELGVAVPAESGPTVLDWNLNFDLDNGSVQAGCPIEHIFGELRLIGQSDGRMLMSRGELNVDSAIVRGVQLTQIRGPLWIDAQRLLAGARAEREVQGRSPRSIVATAFDGEMSLDGELHFADGRFELQSSLENADLARVAEQLCPAQGKLTGTVFGIANVTGTTLGVHTWRGDGQVRLKDADIYELPVMVALLKLLSIQRPDRTAFTTSNMDFKIEGDELEFTRIDFQGDAVTLKGKGRMTGERDVDLKFYTQLGRDEMQLPFFRPVLGEINRQFLLIEMTGSLDHPHVTKTAFPRLNEQLSQIFPELALLERQRPSGQEPSRSGAGQFLRRAGLLPGKE